MRRMDMYNTFFDYVFMPGGYLLSRGVFAGYNEFMSRTRLKQYIQIRDI